MNSKGYAIFRNLSLDVVLGGVASGAMVMWMLDAKMPWIWWVALPMAIWVIYTADHLLDAYRLKNKASTPRHLFHHTYFKPIAVVWSVGMMSCLTWVIYFSPMKLIELGLGMGVLVMIHLALVVLIGKKISWMFHKELGVGLIYSLGVWGGPMVMELEKVDAIVWLQFTQFTLMALVNLLFFSLYESETDREDGHTSFVLAIGPQKTYRLLATLMVLSAAIAIYLFAIGILPKFMAVQGIFGLMLLVLFLVTFLPKWFGERERYRAWGDAVFLFPILIWLL